MKKADILPVWLRILRGYKPFLSIEITRECPLRCPGCYAYEPEHLAGGVPLRQLRDLKGDALVEGVLDLVYKHRPLHVSIVGGEPLVRYRELDVLLPQLNRMGIEVQLVTSAVRPIPSAWAKLPNLHLAVSIDGLPAEHDRRRAPATYDRILKHIAGHLVIVHCTITRQLLARPGYLEEFVAFWSARREARNVWFSLFTPQHGDCSEERLEPQERVQAIQELTRLRPLYPKLYVPPRVMEAYLRPPDSPDKCTFALTTMCISADLETAIAPCQFGGRPVCSECGCFASAGMSAISRVRLGGLLPISAIFEASRKIGDRWGRPVEQPQTPLRVLPD
ncbi:MAG TPA: radical SAM protein [Bryobacteraceae bacterium]|nr:radical SAM protein [Bryobacteraceae bacterium]